MYIEVLSLFTALCYGLSAVLARKGMRSSNPLTGAFVATFTQVIILSGVLSISPPKSFDWMAVIYFTASGILASTFGRLCNYMSIERVGVPISASIIGSTDRSIDRSISEIILRKSSIKYFGISGVIVSLGWLSMFNAFTAGEVSTVATLIGTYPLCSVMLSWLMLRSSDKLGWRVVAGCSVIASGATIVTLF